MTAQTVKHVIRTCVHVHGSLGSTTLLQIDTVIILVLPYTLTYPMHTAGRKWTQLCVQRHRKQKVFCSMLRNIFTDTERAHVARVSSCSNYVLRTLCKDVTTSDVALQIRACVHNTRSEPKQLRTRTPLAITTKLG